MSIPTTSTTETTTELVAHYPSLPSELWLLIFRFATTAPILPSSKSEYEPFQPRHETIIALSNAALRDKCAITLVCKQWRVLAGDMRYEDIRIGRSIAALHDALSEPAAPGTMTARHRVRRAVLPYAHTATPTHHAPPALALLALLPHLEVLVRPPTPTPPPSRRPSTPAPFSAPRFEFTTAAPFLPALRRLDWAFDRTGAAARAGGINSLAEVLAAAPVLHELVLTGRMPPGALRQHRQRILALRTLRLHAGAGACPLVARQTTYWVLPALENVVVEGTARAEALEALWETFGRQLRGLELELGGGVSMGDVDRIVRACPALEELNLRLGVKDLDLCSNSEIDTEDSITQIWASTHNTLQRVGICVDAGKLSVKTWMVLPEYVEKLGKACPALREVVLYVQDVEDAEQNSQFHALHETSSLSGRLLLLRSVHAQSK